MKTKIRRRRIKTRAPTARASRAVRAGMDAVSKTSRANPLQIKSILVPTDFSMPSMKALDYAVPFAEQFGAKLTLLHVVEPIGTPDFANSFPLVMESDRVITSAKYRLEGLIKNKAGHLKLVEKILVRLGRSYHEIVDAARSLKVDLIIIATHGYTGLKHAWLGSTTERVVRHAPCPVLVVRECQHDFVSS